MTNTMRKVPMVVPVLITICQLGEKPKHGPLMARANVRNAAMQKAAELPVHLETFEACQKQAPRNQRAWGALHADSPAKESLRARSVAFPPRSPWANMEHSHEWQTAFRHSRHGN